MNRFRNVTILQSFIASNVGFTFDAASRSSLKAALDFTSADVTGVQPADATLTTLSGKSFSGTGNIVLKSYADAIGAAAQPVDSTLTQLSGKSISGTGNIVLKSYSDAGDASVAAASQPVNSTLTTLSGKAFSGTGNIVLKTYVDDTVAGAVTGLQEIKGAIDCSANPNYPAASNGDTYRVSVAGRIGGGSGKQVSVGDMIIAFADNAGGTQASVGASWAIGEGNIEGLSTLGIALAVMANPGVNSLVRLNTDGTVTQMSDDASRDFLSLNADDDVTFLTLLIHGQVTLNSDEVNPFHANNYVGDPYVYGYNTAGAEFAGHGLTLKGEDDAVLHQLRSDGYLNLGDGLIIGDSGAVTIDGTIAADSFIGSGQDLTDLPVPGLPDVLDAEADASAFVGDVFFGGAVHSLSGFIGDGEGLTNLPVPGLADVLFAGADATSFLDFTTFGFTVQAPEFSAGVNGFTDAGNFVFGPLSSDDGVDVTSTGAFIAGAFATPGTAHYFSDSAFHLPGLINEDGDVTATGAVHADGFYDLELNNWFSSIAFRFAGGSFYSDGTDVFATGNVRAARGLFSSDFTAGFNDPQIVASNAIDSDFQFQFAYESGHGVGYISAQEVGVIHLPVVINPEGGSVGIGTWSPSSEYALEVNGTVAVNELAVAQDSDFPFVVAEGVMDFGYDPTTGTFYGNGLGGGGIPFELDFSDVVMKRLSDGQTLCYLNADGNLSLTGYDHSAAAKGIIVFDGDGNPALNAGGSPGGYFNFNVPDDRWRMGGSIEIRDNTGMGDDDPVGHTLLSSGVAVFAAPEDFPFVIGADAASGTGYDPTTGRFYGLGVMAIDSGWTGNESAGDKAVYLTNYAAPDFSGLDPTDIGLAALATQMERVTKKLQALNVALFSGLLPNVA